IPSVIANEFNNTTYDLHRSALVELGLVLLLVSIGVNSFARFLIWRVGRQGNKAGLFSSLLTYFRRRTSETPVSSAPTGYALPATPRATSQAIQAGLPKAAPAIAAGTPPASALTMEHSGRQAIQAGLPPGAAAIAAGSPPPSVLPTDQP